MLVGNGPRGDAASSPGERAVALVQRPRALAAPRPLAVFIECQLKAVVYVIAMEEVVLPQHAEVGAEAALERRAAAQLRRPRLHEAAARLSHPLALYIAT